MKQQQFEPNNGNMGSVHRLRASRWRQTLFGCQLGIIALATLLVACGAPPPPTLVTQTATTAAAAPTSSQAPTRTEAPQSMPVWKPLPTRTPLGRAAPARTPARQFVSTPGPTRTPKPGQVLWRGDLHMHTTCSDGNNSYEEMIAQALALEFDFLAVTDHDAFIRQGPCQDMLVKCQAEKRLLCIPSEEQTGTFHVIALGVQGDTDYVRNPPLRPQVEAIHRASGWAIAAHPYAQTEPFLTGGIEEYLIQSGIDAWECGKSTDENNEKQRRLAEQYTIPCVYASDAHRQQDLGKQYTECSVPVNSLDDLKAALIGKKCKLGRPSH